jgi:cytohesin
MPNTRKSKSQKNPFDIRLNSKEKFHEKFHIAAMNGDVEKYTQLVENEDDKNPADEQGFTPLYIAADRGHFELCKSILETESVIDGNPRIYNGDTPLHSAAQNGHYKICELIVNESVNKNPKNDAGFTPLYVAVQNGFLDICKLIIENVKDKNPANKAGLTPLHTAAAVGHFKICNFIIENLKVKNPPNPNTGRTPLHYAAHYGHLKICKFIRSKVKEKNPEDLKGITPHCLALKHIDRLFEISEKKSNISVPAEPARALDGQKRSSTRKKRANPEQAS